MSPTVLSLMVAGRLALMIQRVEKTALAKSRHFVALNDFFIIFFLSYWTSMIKISCENRINSEGNRQFLFTFGMGD